MWSSRSGGSIDGGSKKGNMKAFYQFKVYDQKGKFGSINYPDIVPNWWHDKLAVAAKFAEQK